MYYLKIKTKYNLIKVVTDDFYDENIQQLIRQPYVQGVFLRYIDEKEYETNQEYNKVKRLTKEAK